MLPKTPADGENSEEMLCAVSCDESEIQAPRAAGVMGSFPDGDRSVP